MKEIHVASFQSQQQEHNHCCQFRLIALPTLELWHRLNNCYWHCKLECRSCPLRTKHVDHLLSHLKYSEYSRVNCENYFSIIFKVLYLIRSQHKPVELLNNLFWHQLVLLSLTPWPFVDSQNFLCDRAFQTEKRKLKIYCYWLQLWSVEQSQNLKSSCSSYDKNKLRDLLGIES